MFWIILLPPLVDFFISKGRGFELSYLIKGGDILFYFILPFNPWLSVSGVSIGMKLEIIMVMILSFLWVFIKRRNILFSFIAGYLIYLAILLAGLLPLLIANICGMDFTTFYSAGGILYYDTQKFAAVFFGLFFILMNLILFLFFKKDFKRIFSLHPIEILLVLTSVFGFFVGLKSFLSIKPDFFTRQDYLALVVFFLSTFLSMRFADERIKLYATCMGLFSSLVISYYFFLALLVVVIALRLGMRYNKIFRILLMIVAFFFSFLGGLSIFTHERAFSSLVQRNNKIYELKSNYNEEELLIKGIEEKIKNQKWEAVSNFYSTCPYFISPPALFYLEGLYYIQKKEYARAEEFINGAMKLGYKTESAYLTLGKIKYFLKRYDEAIRICKELLKSDFKNSEVYRLLAAGFFEINDYLNSITYYKSGIALAPYDASLYNNLGVAYLKLKEYKKAKEAFIKALTLRPDFPEAKKNLKLVERMHLPEEDEAPLNPVK